MRTSTKNAAVEREITLHAMAHISEWRTREGNGDKVVNVAIAAAIKAKRNREFFEQKRPYSALMKWYRSL